MRWGLFPTGEIKESEHQILITINKVFFMKFTSCSNSFFSGILDLGWLFLWTMFYVHDFDGASSRVARAQQALKARAYVEGSRGMFPWKLWKLELLKSPEMSYYTNIFLLDLIVTGSKTWCTTYMYDLYSASWTPRDLPTGYVCSGVLNRYGDFCRPMQQY